MQRLKDHVELSPDGYILLHNFLSPPTQGIPQKRRQKDWKSLMVRDP